jgi:hypothetical protein
MPISVRPYRAADDPAIERLNARFAAAGVDHRQFTGVEGADRGAVPRETMYVVADDEEIRGGAFVREFPFVIGSETVTVGSVKFPLSESLADRRFAGVPAALLLHLMRRHPYLMAVGMGGDEGPFAQVLARLGWAIGHVDTFLCPLRPHAVLRALPHIQRSPRLAALARILRYTGAARMMSLVTPSLLSAWTRGDRRWGTIVPVSDFPESIDGLRPLDFAGYQAGMHRTAAVLNWLYPAAGPGIRRFLVEHEGHVVGWFAYQVVDLRPLGERAQFGPLLMGFVLESYAAPGNAAAVIGHLLRTVALEGVDLVLANHSHPQWHSAYRRAGFLTGPKRFGCYRSPGLERALHAHGFEGKDLYVTRGDDGYYTL